MDKNKILIDLRHDWNVSSIDSEMKGYWNFDGDSFDLRALKLGDKLTSTNDGDIYLTIDNGSIQIKIVGNESYYEINNLTETELNLTCYLQSDTDTIGLTKLATFTLQKK